MQDQILPSRLALLCKGLRPVLHEGWLLLCVALAEVLRLILIAFHWPQTNSDEANMGLVALHVAYQGDHPVFFYGLPYMGPLEGYVAAVLFRLFGPTLFTLRLGLLFFNTGFLISTYYLLRLLYGRRFALASVTLLSLGSADVLFLQMRASGEYPELLMFAPLICWLAGWLALTGDRRNERIGRRSLVYGLLGLSIGLAIWVDFLIGPFVLAAGLLLLLFCRRELLQWQGLSLLSGLLIGAAPLIYYNLTAPLSQNSLAVLLSIHHGGASDMLARHLTWLNQISGALFIALPWATGANPRCPIAAIPPWGLPTPATLPCVLFQVGWGLGYLALGGLATVLCLQGVRRLLQPAWWRLIALTELDPERRSQAVRLCLQLGILLSVALTLGLYAIAPVAAVSPETTFRYLTCLLIALPILLWPVWHRLQSLPLAAPGQGWRGQGWRTRTAAALNVVLLALVALTFLCGTVRAFGELPAAKADYQRRMTVISDLEQIGATRVYSEYWTCNWLIFMSREDIICSVLNARLQPGFNRYSPYRSVVDASPRPAYVFPIAAGLLDATTGRAQVAAFQARQQSSASRYRTYLFEGYLVFQPAPS
jgi:hypothetical protein